MSRLDYWHPVFASRDLTVRRPAGVKLDGRSIALFRTGDGQLGAIEDKCAHRRMKLSLGCVENGRVICPYHGWSFDAEGKGESPSAPKLRAAVTAYDCAEKAGVIWVKARGTGYELPRLDMEGWTYVGAVFNKARVPLDLVVDNFSEIEHTVTMHPDFGFDRERASVAVMQVETSNETVTVHNHGPAKIPPLDTRLALAFRPGDEFHSNYTFRFDPPSSSVTHLWTDPVTGKERRLKYHVFHYFVPEENDVTVIVTFGFLQLRWPFLRHLAPQIGWLFRRKLKATVEEDAFLLENLADKSPSIEGMKLSRFDTVLGLTRERLWRVYDGK